MATELATLTTTDLQRILTALEPTAYLLPGRLLRRLIKQDREVSGLGLQVPHQRSYVTTRDSVLRSLDHAELGLPADHPLPPVCILIASPGNRRLAAVPPARSLLELWRALFHARIHVELERRLRGATAEDWQRRLAGIGQTGFAEIQMVLRQDGYLLPPADEREVYIEFAAVYLELRYFAAPLLPYYFPALTRPEAVEKMLAQDTDAEQVFRATRPAGAAQPEFIEEPETETAEAEPTADIIDQLEEGPLPGVLEEMLARLRGDSTIGKFRTLIRRAKKAARRGNHVRAALTRLQASWIAPAERRDEIRAGALAELDRLTNRLQAALQMDARETARWRRAVRLLLEPAACGFWPTEARLLHDLQKVCLDHEHELYKTDLVDWALSLGRRPIRRALPCQRLVLRLRHLRTAARRVRSARIDESDKARLAALCRAALQRARNDMRERLRPVLNDSLQGVGMRPANLPERAAASKLTEELLDRIEDQGFLTMGHLRDAISRNNLKLPDLGREDRPAWTDGFGPFLGRLFAGAREFFRGDRLLRADRALAGTLDGVYHRGEFYLRWLQRLSAVAFGTRTGRFVTLYAALPFGGAFMLLFMCLELRTYAHLPARLLGWTAHGIQGSEAAHKVHVHWPSPLWVILLGLLFLGLLHWPDFRRAVVRGLVGLGQALRWSFVDLPVLVRRWPPVRWLLESLPIVLFRRYVFKPLVAASLAGLFLRALGTDLATILTLGGATFLTTAVFFNTRLGRDVEETVTDWIVRTWQWLHFDLIPGFVRWLLSFFKRLLEDVDRFLYRVDEWLRFRSGERPVFQVLKPALGLVWYVVTYVVRFFINVLIEPQINPIKHFPVVTVSHKLVLALFVPPFSEFLMSVVGYEKATALATAGMIGLMPPGLFGFLVWELKENWRLYRANQPAELRPVAIGHHGETMVRLLRPGVHSGTLPKLYTRLRKGGQTAYGGGEWRVFRRQREALHHLEERLRAFVERELAFLLNESPAWGPSEIRAGAVDLGTNRVRLDLACPALGDRDLAILFEEREGCLLAGIAEPGWLPHVTEEQARVLQAALTGLYKMTGVDLVSTPTETDNHSPVVNGVAAPAGAIALCEVSLSWHAWVAIWQVKPGPRPATDGVPVLSGEHPVQA